MVTETQSVHALDHVCYEIGRLAELYVRYLNTGAKTTAAVRDNDLVELIVIHARCLLDFFQTKKLDQSHKTKADKLKRAQNTDIIAENFHWLAKKLDVAAETVERMNKEVAHLTQFRCTQTEITKQWLFKDFVPVILKECENFIAYVEKNHRSGMSNLWLNSAKRNLATWQMIKTEFVGSGTTAIDPPRW